MGRATSRPLQAARLCESPFFIRVCASESVPRSAISLVQRGQERRRTTLGYGRVGTRVHVGALERPEHAGVFVGQRHDDEIPRLLLPQHGDPPPNGVHAAWRPAEEALRPADQYPPEREVPAFADVYRSPRSFVDRANTSGICLNQN